MKIFRLLTVAGCLILTSALMASATPVEVFTGFRKAMEDNDDAAARTFTGKNLLTNLTDNGIPADLRKKVRLTTRAFEDTFVRHNTHSPQQADVYAFYKLNGKEVTLKIAMEADPFGNFKIISISPASQPSAKVALTRFLTACYELDNQEYLLSVSPEIAQRHPVIPEGLRPRAAFKDVDPYDPNEFRTTLPVAESIRPDIEFKTADAGSNKFSVTIGSNKGYISLTNRNMQWVVTDISEELCHPHPFQIAEKFFNYFRIYRKHMDESGSRIKAEEFARLQKFITPMINPAMKNFIYQNLSEANIDRFAGFAGMESFTPVAGNKFRIIFKVDTKDEIGTMMIQMVKKDNQWMVDNFSNADRIYSKSSSPSLLVKKYFEDLYIPANKTFKVIDATEKMSSLNDTVVSVKLEFIQDEFRREINVNVPMKLANSKWAVTVEPKKIDVLNTPEPEKELIPAPEPKTVVTKPVGPEILSW